MAAFNGEHNDAMLIQRELDRFTDYVDKLEKSGHIDHATAERQLSAAFEVEDCFPTNPYMPIKWTPKGVQNLRAIRQFNRKHALNATGVGTTVQNADAVADLPFNATI